MRKRYSRSYTVLSFLTMFSYREHPSETRFLLNKVRISQWDKGSYSALAAAFLLRLRA